MGGQHYYKDVCFLKYVKAIIYYLYLKNKHITLGFPGGTVVKNLPANAGDTGSRPGPGRSHMP